MIGLGQLRDQGAPRRPTPKASVKSVALGRGEVSCGRAARSDHPGQASSAEIQASVLVICYGTAIERDVGMHRQGNFLSFISLAVAIATPVLGQNTTSGVGPTTGVKSGASSIPDFTRSWSHPSFPWFEPPESRPGPVTNLSRWPQRPGNDGPPDRKSTRLNSSHVALSR